MARNLRPEEDLEILLIAINPCQQALSELDLVAVGPPRPQFCELWHPTVFKELPVTVCYNRLKDVHSEKRKAIVGEDEEVPYWRLVLATGAIPFLPPIPGLKEHATTMWSVEDAQKLQQQIDEAFKSAARLADRNERQRKLSFAVVGGGATGVEIIGTLAQLLPKRLTEAGLSPRDLRLSLIEGRDDILFDLPEPERRSARERLAEMGVEVLTGSLVDRVEDDAIYLKDGRSAYSHVLVWAGGVRPDPHAVEWGLEASRSGRLVVDEYLKAKGHDDIYIIGDVAEAKDPRTGQALPMLAQMAIQEGPYVAESVLREARGEKIEPFKPKLRGEFVSVGPSWGVGVMYGRRLRGIPAIVMKRLTYVKYWLQVGGLPLAWRRTREMLAMGR
jgi:NADH dehydrogenase